MSAAILALAVAQTASAAGPDTGSVNARLDVQAEASCASSSDVAESVARRSARIRFVSDGSDVTRFRASVRLHDKGDYAAELSVVQASGRRSSRRFVVKSCAEAVDALALVIVMTLDPESGALREGGAATGASEGGGDGRAATTGTAGSAGASARSASAGSAGSSAGTAAASSSAKQTSDDQADSGVAPGDEGSSVTSPRSDLTVGAVAQGLTGPAPSLMPGLAVQALWALERGSAWSPAARISAGYHWLAGVEETGGVASFQLPLFALELCPLRLGPAGVALRPCLLGAVGPLTASGSDTFDPQRVTRPFAALGASLIASVDLGEKLQLCGNVGLGASLIPDTFAFSPHVFHEIPGLSALFGLGVGYRFSVIE